MIDYMAIICPYSMNRKYSVKIIHTKIFVYSPFWYFQVMMPILSNKNDEKLELLGLILLKCIICWEKTEFYMF